MYYSLLLTIVVSCLAAPLHGNSRVQLPTGQYHGYHDCNTSTTVYYGVPYAFAPRFEAPIPIERLPGIDPDVQVDASHHGPACVNFKLPPPYDVGFSSLLGATPIEPQSEDCLTVDVYVPDGHHKDLPVLVYTPGGGFLVGASFAYDMRPLLGHAVELGRPFIAVVLNYRLGPLGFLNPSTLGARNAGILDQFEALTFIQHHIAVFGGDPNKVTIMGESAGAESTMHQLLWHKEVFRAAWMMSVPSSGLPWLRVNESNRDGLIQNYAETCGCPKNRALTENIACLNQTDVSILVNQSVAWEGASSTIGGVIRGNVFSTLRADRFPRIPIVVTSCRDEGTSSAIGFNSSNDETTAYAVQILVNSADRLSDPQAAKFQEQMLEAYPNDPSEGCPYDGKNTTYGQPSQYKRISAIMTDSQYTEAWLEYLEAFSPSKVWGILFDEPIPNSQPDFGVQHGSDLIFYFPSLFGPDLDPREMGYRGLVDTIHNSLTNFVHDLSLKSDGYDWPLYGAMKNVTQLSASGPVSVIPPYRPGFSVIRDNLRPPGFAT